MLDLERLRRIPLDAGQDGRVLGRIDNLLQGVFDAQTENIHQDPGYGIVPIRKTQI